MGTFDKRTNWMWLRRLTFSVLAVCTVFSPPWASANAPANDKNRQQSDEQNPPSGVSSAPDTSAGPNEWQPANQKPGPPTVLKPTVHFGERAVLTHDKYAALVGSAEFEKCQNTDLRCVVLQMRKVGATPDAITFVEAMSRTDKGLVYLASFVHYGRVDRAVIEDIFQSGSPWYDPTTTLLVNGQPSVVEVGANPDNYPETPAYNGGFSTHAADFEHEETLQNGGQRFIFALPVVECHPPCEARAEKYVAGYVHYAYDFNASGRFLGHKFLSFGGPASLEKSQTETSTPPPSHAISEPNNHAVASAAIPSFDCSLAHTWGEHQICANTALATADHQVGELYRRARAQQSSSASIELRAEQRTWIKTREACKSAVDPLNCLKGVYQSRIVALGAK